VEDLKILTSAIIGFLIIYALIKSYLWKRDRDLISSVTSLTRGTPSEKLLILQLLKKETPPITIFHDLIIKKENDEYSQIDLVLVTSEGIIVFEVKDFSGWIYGSGNNTTWTKVLSFGKKSISSTTQLNKTTVIS
jgi:hypothetical protein